LLVGGKLPLATFRAVLGGFTDLDQPELIELYQPAYFDAVGPVWKDWSSAMAQDFVSGLYLVCPVASSTVEATDAYLTEASPAAALRRLLNEGRDDVLRALRCQERDRQEA
jgi:aminopeptidase N